MTNDEARLQAILDKYVPIMRAAAECGYYPTYVRSLADTGQVRSIRVLGQRLIHKEDVEMLKRRRQAKEKVPALPAKRQRRQKP